MSCQAYGLTGQGSRPKIALLLRNGAGFYHLSFWAEPYRPANGMEYMIPYMSGFGGNRVVFNPNGIISFRFTDAGSYDLNPLVKVADGIQPFSAKKPPGN